MVKTLIEYGFGLGLLYGSIVTSYIWYRILKDSGKVWPWWVEILITTGAVIFCVIILILTALILGEDTKN